MVASIGWTAGVGRCTVADVDLALNLLELDHACPVDVHSVVTAPGSIMNASNRAGIAGDLASLLAAHHQQNSGVVAGMKGATGRLLASIVNPSRWAPAVAWGIGLASNRLEQEVADRLAAYHKSQQPATQASRRAA